MLDFSQNYFALFDLAPGFDLDAADLMGRYREVQSRIHPDRYAGGSEQEQRLAVQMASRVNEAFQCLKHPLRRAQYLLELAGHPVAADARTHQDPAFLMEQIELREALERASHEHQDHALADLMACITQKSTEQQRAFREAYAARDYHCAAEAVTRWQFLVKLQADAERLEEQADRN